MKKKYFFLLIISLAFFSCKSPENKPTTPLEKKTSTMPILNDSHSYAHFAEAKTTHLSLNLTAHFDQNILKGTATHTIKNNKASQIIFDTKGLSIEKVTLDGTDKKAEFSLGEKDEILGRPLFVSITPQTTSVTIYYATQPSSEAVQWLNPKQTAYKKFPFLFTQGEAILTRSWIPIQDSPGNKISYDATISVPDSLTAVMSAKPIKSDTPNTFKFEMEHPIPCYLIALAIGKLEYAKLGERSGVYAEPNMLDACVYEFQDIEKMIAAAESLYGKYEWGQYDVIVLPPSFPFGGMENPRLTFATPTIIAGDRSLTSLVAHELAHSWSGNLVTNSTWNDFWLNEGFTVYFENRITEALYGKDYADMLAVLGFQDLKKSIKQLKPADTHLKLNLKGRNPDDGMTDIAYEKGHNMLKMIEYSVGREKMDAFLVQYFTDFKFKNLTTEEFLEYAHEKLPESKELNLEEWIYKPGLPKNCPKIISKNFNKVDSIRIKYKSDIAKLEVKKEIKKWSTHEWLRYIRGIDTTWTIKDFENVDKAYSLTNSTNAEIAAAWFEESIKMDYKAVYPKLEEFLIKVGRRKFLTPLYTALLKAGEKETALEIYKKARVNYHFVSTNSMDELLAYKKR